VVLTTVKIDDPHFFRFASIRSEPTINSRTNVLPLRDYVLSKYVARDTLKGTRTVHITNQDSFAIVVPIMVRTYFCSRSFVRSFALLVFMLKLSVIHTLIFLSNMLARETVFYRRNLEAY